MWIWNSNPGQVCFIIWNNINANDLDAIIAQRVIGCTSQMYFCTEIIDLLLDLSIIHIWAIESSPITEEISVRVGAQMHWAAITEKTKGQEMKRGVTITEHF